MKSSQQFNALVVGLSIAVFPGALGQTYGPNGCVSISRSQQGTCVIATNCAEEVSLDKLEFAFDCQTKAQVQKHSFGVGGFDSVEEFDTGIKCGKCKVPQNHKVHKVTKKSAVHMFAKRNAAQEDALVDKYGPGGCVEAYRGTTGTCMIRTQCKGQDISNYDVGLLCVSNVTSGENVRHLFGKNSFDPEEEFDTLIKCEKCLGLKAEATQAAATAVDAGVESGDLVKKVNTLVDEVGAMQTGLEKIKDDVKVLNEKVPKLYAEGEAKEGESKEGEGKKSEAKEEEKEGEGKDEEKKDDEKKDEDAKDGEGEDKKPEAFLSHHRSSRHSHKKHQRHHHKRRRSHDEDEDNDEDKADEDDDSSVSKKDSREQDDEEDEDDHKDKDQEDSNDKEVDENTNDSEDAN